MMTIEMTEATAPLAEYARRVAVEPMILTMDRKPIAALVPIENSDLETLSVSTQPEFLAIIEKSRLRQQTEGGISSEQMRRRLGLSQ